MRNEAACERRQLDATTKAEGIRVVEGAKVETERERMEIYRDLRAPVLMGLAAQELAGKLRTIQHLNVSPELFGPMLGDLITAGTRRLAGPEGETDGRS